MIKAGSIGSSDGDPEGSPEDEEPDFLRSEKPAQEDVQDALSKLTVPSEAPSLSGKDDAADGKDNKEIVMKGPSDLILGTSRGSIKAPPKPAPPIATKPTPKRGSFDGSSLKRLSAPLNLFNRGNAASSSSPAADKVAGAQSTPLAEPATKTRWSLLKGTTASGTTASMFKKLMPSALRNVGISSMSSRESLDAPTSSDHDSLVQQESLAAHKDETPRRLSSSSTDLNNLKPDLKKEEIQSSKLDKDALEPFKNQIEDLTQLVDKINPAKLAWVKASDEIHSEHPTLVQQMKELRTLWEAKHKEVEQDAKDTHAIISALTEGMQAAGDEVQALLDLAEDEEDDLVARAIDVVKSQADKEKDKKKDGSWRMNRLSKRISNCEVPDGLSSNGLSSPMPQEDSKSEFGASDDGSRGASKENPKQAVL